MKAAVLYAPGDLRIVERSIPTPGPDMTLVRIRTAQVSLSELNILRGVRPHRKLPVIPGHEFSGVIAGGSLPNGLAIGDRIIADDHVTCGKCYYCKRSMSHICSNAMVYGVDLDGAFQENMLVNSKTIYKLPDEVSLEEGAFIEPLSTCVDAVKRSAASTGDTAVVLGQGLMGLMVVQLLKANGVRTITADLLEHKVNLSKKFGADHAIDASKEDLVKRVLDLTDGVGADVVIEATGAGKAFEQAFEITRKGATIVQIGHIYKPPAFPAITFYYKDLKIVSGRGYSVTDALQALGTHKIDVKSLITHTFKLEEIKQAYEARARDDAIVVQLRI